MSDISTAQEENQQKEVEEPSSNHEDEPSNRGEKEEIPKQDDVDVPPTTEDVKQDNVNDKPTEEEEGEGTNETHVLLTPTRRIRAQPSCWWTNAY